MRSTKTAYLQGDWLKSGFTRRTQLSSYSILHKTRSNSALPSLKIKNKKKKKNVRKLGQTHSITQVTVTSVTALRVRKTDFLLHNNDTELLRFH